ncbi:RNA polymerase sigma factor [Anaerosphaera multitolerans]|uniref:Sigma-70 family RNA polymerase sigma factor n=1 Tax=Anaerosphaera multitolerans TaxID=2487351 RepID=A0A437S6V5_9FIRM|nr:sigma-70 family RNA polymerase sigma factor [Anaerosphaera multitolerans]RVU54746.1 sigma-70 family RNA polymerase sigma factor [Anaerosphaera multitolerans]
MENVTTDYYREVIDTLSFDEIYEKFYTKVYRYVGYRIYNKSDVEDLVSQIFLKIYKNFNSYNSNSGSYSQWIFTIAGNTIKDYHRKNSIRNILSLGALNKEPEDDFSMEENFERLDEYKYLRKIIHNLPKREQNLISLRYGAELSYDEIAGIMKLKPNHVGVLLHRSLKKIKSNMEEYYDK